MKLKKREKILIYPVSAFICLIIISKFVISPVMENRKQLERVVKVKTGIIEKMIEKKKEYDSIIRESKELKGKFVKRDKGVTLFSYLDRLSGETGVKDNIAYMKPSTSSIKGSTKKITSVEIKLQGINAKQLVSYLYKIETSKNILFVRRLSILKSGRQKEYISAVIQVETFET